MTRDRVPAFYEQDGLHVAVYDGTSVEIPGGDDVAFFDRLAHETGGPVLELGCGTGRVAAPLAEAGHRVVGLDLSAAMLAAAERRRATLSAPARRRLRFVRGDMADFRLGRRFGLVFAAYRVFQFLPDPERQRTALATIRRHLRPGGLLVLDLFDPRHDLLGPDTPPLKSRFGPLTHARTGRPVEIVATERVTDPVVQRFTERWRFRELGESGEIVAEEHEDLTLRWTYRYELWHLLELAGFERVAEYSDYAGSPPAYAGEIIAVARRPTNPR